MIYQQNLRIKNHTPKVVQISMKKSNIRKYLVPSRPKTNVKCDVKVHATT